MTTTTMSPRGRSAVNIVAILTCVILLAFSLWGGSAFGSAKTGESPDNPIPSIAHFFAGALGIAGVLLAQRRPGVGRFLLLAGAGVLLVTLSVLRYFGTWAWVSLIVPATVLILCAMLLRPAPPPEPAPRMGGDIRPPGDPTPPL